MQITTINLNLKMLIECCGLKIYVICKSQAEDDDDVDDKDDQDTATKEAITNNFSNEESNEPNLADEVTNATHISNQTG